MTNRSLRNQVLALLSGFVALIAVSDTPMAQSQTLSSADSASQQITFEVFSLRPSAPGQSPVHPVLSADGFTMTDTLFGFIETAYNPLGPRFWSPGVNHLPRWAAVQVYSMNARVRSQDVAVWQAQGGRITPVLRSALQAALKECCGLSVSVRPTQVPHLDLVIAKNGPKLSVASVYEVAKHPGGNMLGEGHYYDTDGRRHFVSVSMDEFVLYLMRVLPDVLIQNKTGINGRYDFDLSYYGPNDGLGEEPSSPMGNLSLGNIGLLLKKGVGPCYALDVLSIHRPLPN